MVEARELRVAAVQVQSLNGAMRENLARAEPLVARAAAQGAQLVLCPEFLAAGYIYDESIWRAGEPRGGPTETWLQRLAAAHHVYLGASYLEADGDDFFNTFSLAAPDGSIAGRVRKESLPGFEGWYFKSCAEPKIIDTKLGRIAVGICQDNHTARFFRRVMRDDPDLVLMPHSAPCIPFAAGLMRDALSEVGGLYARSFGVPVVVVNKVLGRCESPVPGVPLLRLPFDFPGLSSIYDSDARRLEHLADGEGVLVADVQLDSSRKRRPDVPKDAYWSRPPRLLPRVLGAWFVAMENLAKRMYAKSAARRTAARSISTTARAAPTGVEQSAIDAT